MEHIQKTIDDALMKLKEQEAQVTKTKTLINNLREWMGQPRMFADVDKEAEPCLGGFRSDQFYGQPLSGVVRDILEARKRANLGPATVAEIYAAMMSGGYKFEAANPENAKRALRISLTKNSATFHRLPNGSYGLREWYPNVKEARNKPGSEDATPPDGDANDADAFEFEEKEREDTTKESARQKSA